MDDDEGIRTATWLGATKHHMESGWSGKDAP
jgi:hypothetical protein